MWKCIRAATDPMFLNGEFMKWVESNIAGRTDKITNRSKMFVVALAINSFSEIVCLTFMRLLKLFTLGAMNCHKLLMQMNPFNICST
jgi:hypothetical protein